MFQKFIAAAAAFLMALAILPGCSPQDTKSSTEPKSPPLAVKSSEDDRVADKSRESPAADVPEIHPVEPKSKPADPAPDLKSVAETTTEKPPSAAAENGSDPGSSVPKNDEPLFQGGLKPQVVIVATGMQMGYIEPCGCSGKENQRGGLSRRHSFLKKLAADGWNVVPLDVGGQVRRFGTQSEFKFQRTADALKAMHYRGIALGTDDLRLPAQALAAPLADNTEAFVSANAALFGFEQKFIPRFQIVSAGKLKLGVTAVLGESARRAINNDDIKFKPADEALKEVVPELKKAGCDRLVLLAHATQLESVELAKKFPEFDFVITSGGAPEPPREPEIVEGTKTRLVEVGQKGEYANVIGLFDDPKQPLRFRMVPLELRLGESDEMKQLMATYQDQLQQQGLEGLGIKPAPHPSGRQFVGSKTCGECHTKAYAVWIKTPHARSLDTLANLKPARQYDPECLSCHVTGWEPQKFYPFQGGYLSLDKTPLLAHNGCENCHGPGSAHVAAENGSASEREKVELRKSMRAVASAETCLQCHDADNSLKFDFKTYWPKVEHKGKD
jgi:Cytochrome c554 and c-prime